MIRPREDTADRMNKKIFAGKKFKELRNQGVGKIIYKDLNYWTHTSMIKFNYKWGTVRD